MVFHKDIASPSGGIHGIVAYEYPDASGRLAASGFIGTDQFKIAHQADTDGFWMLGKISPIEWNQVLVGTGVLFVHHTTHESSGSDQINVSGLAGRLADPQNADTLLGVTVSGVPTYAGQQLMFDGTNWHPASSGFPAAGIDGSVQFNLSGVMFADDFLMWDTVHRALAIGQPTLGEDNPLSIAGSGEGWVEVMLQNKCSGSGSSTDYCATADDGSEDEFCLDMGIDSSTYGDPLYPLTGPHDSYIYCNGGHLVINVETPGKAIKFALGGWEQNNLAATLDTTGMNLASGMSYRVNGGFPSVSGWPGQLFERQDADKIYGVSVSGLLPTSGQVLSYDGNKWLPTPPMELGQFFPVVQNNTIGDFNTRTVGTSSLIKINFQVPKNFDSLISLHAVGIVGSNSTGTGKDIDIDSQYAAEGEAYNNHTGSDHTTTYTISAAGTIWYLDLSTIVASLAAGDSCGILIQHNAIGTGGIEYMGIVLRYRPKRL